MSASRLRIAWWSPLPPDRSGIADYAAELLPHLARHWDVDLWVEGGVAAPALADRHRLFDARRPDAAARMRDYDAVVYHLGNAPGHAAAYRTLLAHPGIVVLHDVSLAHLVIHLTHRQGRTDRLYAEMRAQHGDDAAERLRRYFHLAEPAPWDVDPLACPLHRRVIDAATALLVHSRFAAAHVRAAGARGPVGVLEHHALPPPGVGPAATLPAGAGPDGVVFCTAGFLTPAKRIGPVLRALARLRRRGVPFRYRLVGDTASGYPLQGLVRDAGLLDAVELHGRVSQEELYRLLLASDVCINLRHPTSGETSGMVQRVLASHRPVVVSDVGWFAELPDDAVVKVPAGEGEVDLLAAALGALAREPERRAALARGAARYARRLDPESRAAGYDAFVRRVLEAGSDGVAAELAVALGEAAIEAGVPADAAPGTIAAGLVGAGA